MGRRERLVIRRGSVHFIKNEHWLDLCTVLRSTSLTILRSDILISEVKLPRAKAKKTCGLGSKVRNALKRGWRWRWREAAFRSVPQVEKASFSCGP